MKTSSVFSYLLILLTISISCMKEQAPSSKLDRANVSVTFKTLLSGNTQAMSKMLTEAQENEIQDIEVLAFEQSGDDYLFSYRTSGTGITPVEGAIEFTANLKPYDNSQILVIVANAKANIEGLTIANNMHINDLLPLLVFAKDEGFKTATEADFTPIPMFVKTSPMLITNSTTNIGTCNLIRMLARVDIISVAGGFKLVDAVIYNRKDKGYIAYKDALWNTELEKVSAAHVPADAVSKPDPGITYLAETEGEIASITHSIYTFEAQGVANPMNATAIIIGGYANFPVNTSELSYYRIDIPKFIDSEAQASTCGDILRNHLYRITIEAVLKSGYPSIEEAFKNGYQQLDVDITEWDRNSKIDVNIRKPISIQLDKAHFKYDGVGTKTRELTFTAEGDWTVSTEDDWLEIKTHTIDNNLHTITYTINPLASGSNRLGYIDLRAGNFVKKVSIDQYVGPAITYTPETYLLPVQLDYQLTINAKAPWTWAILSNPSNVIKTFEVESGEGHDGSLVFSFNDQKGEFAASVSIASLDDEFDSYTIPLYALSAYDLAGLYVYSEDQTPSLPWYVYSNTPDGNSGSYVPPTDSRAPQINPPRENSCACLESLDPEKPWRLPTHPELMAIYAVVRLPKISSTPPYYAENPYFNITHGFNARRWYFSANPSSSTHAKVVGFTANPYIVGNPNNGFNIANLIPYSGSSSKKTGSIPFGLPGANFTYFDETEGARCVRDK